MVTCSWILGLIPPALNEKGALIGLNVQLSWSGDQVALITFKTSDLGRVCAERGFAESDSENLNLSKTYKTEMFLHEAHCINF